MTNLIESAGRYLTPNTVAQLGASLGESPAAITRAAPMGIATLIAGLARATNDEAGAHRVLETSRSVEQSGALERYGVDIADESKRPTMLEHGQSLVAGLFGSGYSGVTSTLSQQSGLSRTATNGLLALLVPLVLGVVGKHCREQGLGFRGLSLLLAEQSSATARYLPSGLGSTFTVAEPGARRIAVTDRKAGPVARAGAMGWVLPAVALGGLLVGGYALMRSRPHELSSAPAPSMKAPDVVTPAPALSERPEEPPSAVGGGPSKQEGDAIESAMAGGRGKTFELENVRFDNAASQPRGESSATLDKLAAALKSHPGVRIRLEGHTDSRGNDEINRQLATARAISVRQALVERGIEPSRIEIGEKSASAPIASNDDEEGRQKNRRVSAEVIAP
ncbi:MAG: DUF937 domain-containing protein [Polyangiales bacterium]